MKTLRNRFTRIHSHFNRKDTLIIVLIMGLGILIPLFSPTSQYNFWFNLYNILTNTYCNLFLVLSGILNISLYLKSDYKYNLVNRFSSLKEYVRYHIPDILYMTCHLFFIYILLSVAGAIAFSMNHFEMVDYMFYGISILEYLPFFLVRELGILLFVQLISFFVLEMGRKKFTVLFTILIVSCFVVTTNTNSIISHFYEASLSFPFYFQNIEYSSFSLEVLCSILYFGVLFLVYRLIFVLTTRKKRDIL